MQAGSCVRFERVPLGPVPASAQAPRRSASSAAGIAHVSAEETTELVLRLPRDS